MERFPSLENLDPNSIAISDVKFRSWRFADRKTGKHREGSDKFVEVFNDVFNDPFGSNKLGFSLENVETVGCYEPKTTRNGTIHIRTWQPWLIRSHLVKPLANLIWAKRHGLFTPDVWNEVSTLEELTDALEKAMIKVGTMLIDINMPDCCEDLANRPLAKVELEIDRIIFARNIRVVFQGHQFELPAPVDSSDECCEASDKNPSESEEPDEKDMPAPHSSRAGSPNGSPDISEDEEDKAQDHTQEPDSPDAWPEPENKKVSKASVQFTKLETRQNGLTVFWHILGLAAFLTMLVWWNK